ncbi:M15 family metallopeptidase [Calothrix rhizosoleniae]|uniref:M15 family metallopeptidase n=1 Tax=Calothrix rhizosoleniae TaxID=888997 RepID=UPI000B49DD75|nr:M15 family metallopeptidase [Calothrix rhizosoleniae]
MNNAEFPGKPQNSIPASNDDIPVALRDTPDVKSQVRIHPSILFMGGIAGFIILAIISGFLFALTSPKTTTTSQFSSTNSSTNNNGTKKSPSNGSVKSQTPQDEILGHMAYKEAPKSELVRIPGNKQIIMRKAAAKQFQAMAEAAKKQGVNLVPISGFRTVEQQKALFFGIGAQRNQRPAQRAAVSAPPNYSEHHTGYAVDIGDGKVPATNLSTNFEKTPAFQWLEANAARYSFELSFPKGNSQGVSYEPWHWRFVGDPHSLETFYKSKNIKPDLN